MPSSPWPKPSFLRAFWVALRRAPKDRTARETLPRFIFTITIFIAIFGTYIYMFHGFASEYGLGQLGIVLIPAAVVMLIMFLAIARQNVEQRNIERASPAVSPELRRALFSEACVLAVLLERLASESYLEKEIPPDIVITTRRVLLDRLDEHGLREGLEPGLLDLLLAPDGHWTTEQKQRATGALECLSVLRWVLGLSELRPLTVEPKYSVEEASSVFQIKEPEKLVVLASWDVRPARNAAESFLSRCWAELVARRVTSNAAEQDAERAMAVRAEIKEKGYTRDYVVGVRTIPELETPLLFVVARRAFTRWQFLSVLVDVLAGERPVEEVRKFLAQYFAPAETPETPVAKGSN